MKRAYRFMSALLLGVAMLTCSAAFAAPQAEAPAQKPAYTLAEYNAYQDAAKEKDPAAQIKKLDSFVAMYPQSTLLPYVYRAYYLAYYQMKNYVQTLAYVDKLLALGDKIDLGSRLEGYIARAQAYSVGASDKALQTPEQYTAARDAAKKGLDTLGMWQKPANITDENYAMQKKSLAIAFNNIGGLTSSGLKDYKGAEAFYKAILAIDPKDAVTHYHLGVAYLQDMPPVTMDGYWELATAINLKVPGDDQVRAYLKNQLLHYQQLGCDKLADGEVASMITSAAAGGARPDTFTVPSADDLMKASMDTANFMPWLQEGGDHGKIMWLATCGLEYPDVPVKVIEVKPADGDNITMEVYRSAATDADAQAKDMDAATMANMEIHVVGQPDAKRVSKDDYVRFTGTLSDYSPAPMFLLTWDMAKINMEDIPAEKAAPGAKRPAHKLPGK
jgi:tetratricopeptide (TPR) repeat protein